MKKAVIKNSNGTIRIVLGDNELSVYVNGKLYGDLKTNGENRVRMGMALNLSKVELIDLIIRMLK